MRRLQGLACFAVLVCVGTLLLACDASENTAISDGDSDGDSDANPWAECPLLNGDSCISPLLVGDCQSFPSGVCVVATIFTDYTSGFVANFADGSEVEGDCNAGGCKLNVLSGGSLCNRVTVSHSPHAGTAYGGGDYASWSVYTDGVTIACDDGDKEIYTAADVDACDNLGLGWLVACDWPCDGAEGCPPGFDCAGGQCFIYDHSVQCETDDDCAGELECLYGRCIVKEGEPCYEHSDCEPNQLCDGETCRWAGDANCETDDDCRDTDTCINNYCLSEDACIRDEDCGAWQRCAGICTAMTCSTDADCPGESACNQESNLCQKPL